MNDDKTNIHDQRLGRGLVTALGLVVAVGIGWTTVTFTPAVVGIVTLVGKVVGGLAALVLGIYALGYFWTDVYPRITARLGAWRAHLTDEREQGSP